MLAETSAFLAGRDLFGLIWCDEALRPTHRFGRLSACAPLHESICDSLLPLMGLKEQIRSLSRSDNQALEIPNVTFRRGGEASPRLNVSVYWMAARSLYLVVLGRVLRRSDLELELNHQIRAKRIAERAVAEKSRELERVNTELSRANDDLEEFAYVIAHDLKAPLRALRYVSEDLGKSLAASGSTAGADKLDQLQRQTRRMSAMLSGLFDYASLGRKRDAITRVDTAAMLAQIIASLPAGPGIKFITNGDWPFIETLQQPLDLVLRNLIENAVKHHDRQSAIIEVSAEDAGSAWAFTVSDDGPGIPPDYQSIVFQPFSKVDGERNPDSSGVGLALVKKTVESVGGSIGLVSAPQQARGTTFKVLWPKNMAF